MIIIEKHVGFCWALHAKLYPSVRIDEEKLNTTSGAGNKEVKVKKYEVHIYVMLVVQCMHDHLLNRHGIFWALHAKWYPSLGSTKKIQVKHNLGRLYRGQGQSKIGGSHLHHVGIAMHAFFIC